MSLKDIFLNGSLDLSADKNDRFAFFVKDTNIPINYIKSFGGKCFYEITNYIQVGRAVNTRKEPHIQRRMLTYFDDKLVVNAQHNLLDKKCSVILLDKIKDSKEDKIEFFIKSITPLKDTIWNENSINNLADIYLENVILGIQLK